MKKISNSTKAVVLTTLLLTVIFIFCKRKVWNYKKVNSIEYNQVYNEIYPVIDTIIPYYKNANPIFVRGGYKINGHDKIGVCTGGSQLWFECSDKCKKCLSLNSDE